MIKGSVGPFRVQDNRDYKRGVGQLRVDSPFGWPVAIVRQRPGLADYAATLDARLLASSWEMRRLLKVFVGPSDVQDIGQATEQARDVLRYIKRGEG